MVTSRELNRARQHASKLMCAAYSQGFSSKAPTRGNESGANSVCASSRRCDGTGCCSDHNSAAACPDMHRASPSKPPSLNESRPNWTNADEDEPEALSTNFEEVVAPSRPNSRTRGIVNELLLKEPILKLIGTMTVHEYAVWWKAREGSSEYESLPSPKEFEAIREERLQQITGVALKHARNSTLECWLSKGSTSTCRHCSAKFKVRRECQEHERQCGKRRCEHCCQEFKTPLQCRGHEIVCHSNAEAHCQYCSIRIRNGMNKQEHEDICESNPLLWCDYCGVKFPHKILKDKHVRQCPCQPSRTCRFCSTRFPSRLETVLHQVFCAEGNSPIAPSLQMAECACCCEQQQCIRFPCGSHYFCAMCLFRMARTGIKDRTQLPLKCCRKQVLPGDAVDLAIAQILSEADREKYQEAMLLKSSKNVMYCPRADCGALLALDQLKQIGESFDGPGGCPKCQQALCFECKSEWHAGMTCAQYKFFVNKSKDEVVQICRQNNWMRCFDCGHVVEKKAGCNHITCLCGNEFCYLCGTKWGTCKCQVIGDNHALRHNRAAATGQQHMCPHCRQPYPSQRELDVHVRICRTRLDRQGGAYECANCHRGFPTHDALRNHRRDCQWALHGTFGCFECGVDLNDQGALKRHRRICGATVPGC